MHIVTSHLDAVEANEVSSPTVFEADCPSLDEGAVVAMMRKPLNVVFPDKVTEIINRFIYLHLLSIDLNMK